MLREIRGLEQRSFKRTKRWFQDDYFDLFVWQDRLGTIVEFQLCYRRDTRDERVLDWRRGRGFQHLKPQSRHAGDSFLEDDTWALCLDGAMPYLSLRQRYDESAGGLPAEIARFVRDKIDEYARPARRFRPRGARTPRWLERLRKASRRFLDTDGDGG
ncbi:MAG TPA: hypothetical protein VJ789_12685 [Burkholderiales bacterium]|nr:hypothetical protein [Burkholderiales bacterium]